MKNADRVAAFVHEALVAGRSRSDVEAALAGAGWTEAEIVAGIGAWAEGDFVPPVPRPRPFVSARDAFLYGLMLVALAMTATHLTTLAFGVINSWFPENATEQFSARSQVRWAMSVLVVFFPLFLVLNARAGRAIRTDPGQRRSAVRKWFTYITLFLAAISILGDLIAVVYALLNGDLTLRFLCKAASVAVVAGVIYLYFRADVVEDNAPA